MSMSTVDLPSIRLPLAARTPPGESVWLRPLRPEESLVESASEYDDWGSLDPQVDESLHVRAMIQIGCRVAWPRRVPGNRWAMTWHATYRGCCVGRTAAQMGITTWSTTRTFAGSRATVTAPELPMSQSPANVSPGIDRAGAGHHT